MTLNVAPRNSERFIGIWQIELFFKWLKQHAQIKHFYGTSEIAVINQLLLALMTYTALVLLKLDRGSERLAEFAKDRYLLSLRKL